MIIVIVWFYHLVETKIEIILFWSQRKRVESVLLEKTQMTRCPRTSAGQWFTEAGFADPDKSSTDALTQSLSIGPNSKPKHKNFTEVMIFNRSSGIQPKLWYFILPYVLNQWKGQANFRCKWTNCK